MSSLTRACRRFNAGESTLKRALLRVSYHVFVALPHPLRRLAVAGYISVVLALKRLPAINGGPE